jgi:ribosomal protein L7Ae-like RNA K-turn-binding protein
MNQKVNKYLGFAKKSGNLATGSNTCTFAMAKGKVKLIILAEDISENGEKKILKEIRRNKVQYVKYGDSEEMSRAVGSSGRSVFGVCDKNLAEVISKEISEDLQ